MDWLLDAIFQPSSIQAVIIISLVSALGLELGKLKIFGISLGITFVFFVGIVVGHFDFNINKDMLQFAQNFGLILFVYALGLQVGPGFFPSLKKGGMVYNLLSFAVIIIGTILMLLIGRFTHLSLPNMMGLFMGAVTNTPALGAAQQTIQQLNPNDANTVSDMALACAVAYPMGVVGVILAIILIRTFTKGVEPIKKNNKIDSETYIAEFRATNPDIIGKTIVEMMKHTPKRFIISRIWKDGKVVIPTSKSIIEENDHLLAILMHADLDEISQFVGSREGVDWNKEGIDWNTIDNSQLASQHIVVTRGRINGVRMGTLNLRNIYGVNITRINRAGINLLASPDLALQIGDKLTVVGEKSAIRNAAAFLGDELKQLKEPNLIAIFLGMALGLVLGALPIPFPGMTMPIKLGIAAGPIMVGILMGAFGPRFRITTYTTPSASLMMRKLGLVMYLACMGLNAGSNFFETVLQPEGLLWIAVGFVLTVVPVLIVGFFATKTLRMGFPESMGMLCGSMANPMALSYVNSTVEGDEPSVSYATVYPVAMFLRIVAAQMILLFFL